MKSKLILTGGVIAIMSIGVACYLLPDNNAANNGKRITPLLYSTSNLNLKKTQLYEGRSEQILAQLSDKVVALEARLKRLEATVSIQSKNLYVEATVAPSLSYKEKAQAKQFSEADFSHWMDDALDTGHFDLAETKSIIDKAEKSLAALPGVSVDDMECGKSFCRAKFTPEAGKPLNIAEVFGASPFMGSGFTIDEPDGSVKVYFTQPGQSIDELRREAEKTVLGE